MDSRSRRSRHQCTHGAIVAEQHSSGIRIRSSAAYSALFYCFMVFKLRGICEQ